MKSLRTTLAACAGLALTGSVVLLAAPGAAAAAAADSPAQPQAQAVRGAARALLDQSGLIVQQAGGYLGVEGPAAQISGLGAALAAQGLGNSALFTGAGETGEGFLVLSGEDPTPPPGSESQLAFQVMGMTAASITNNSSWLDAVYSDSGPNVANVAPGTSADFTPVDIDYAAYPAGSTSPPDNRGIDPTAQFTWQTPAAG
jgi:hypothetical protein